MSRFYSYRQLIGVTPAPGPLVIELASQLTDGPGFAAGDAVLAGSTAWGSSTWRSDIDVAAFMRDTTADLEERVRAVRGQFERLHGARYLTPRVDVVWIGSEHEALIERDNLVSRSAPIREPMTVREMLDRTCVRFVDHLAALSRTKGEPWRGFVDRYLGSFDATAELRRSLMSEYVASVATEWRAQVEPLAGSAAAPERAEALEVLGAAESFAYHFIRQVLGVRGAYPAPDRRADVRRSIARLDDDVRSDLEPVLEPLFALGDGYESLADEVQHGATVSEVEFGDALRRLVAAVDIGALEEAVWRYASPDGPK